MNCERLVCKTAATLAVLLTAMAMPVGMAGQESPSSDQNLNHHRYQLTDLGTFGGANSQVNGGPPPMLNNEGIVAGLAETPTPCSYFDLFV
jgi:hypothetical protein